MGVTFSQLWPPSPTLTETNLPSQKDRVFVVTGGYSGVGLELCDILYHAGAKVYIAGRSATKAQEAIAGIESGGSNTPKSSTGQILFLPLDLSDLDSVKAGAQELRKREARVNVLWNNAGVSNAPAGSLSAQGYELQQATNCLGHLLFTRLIFPLLYEAAKSSETWTTRVVWTGSIVIDTTAPKGGFAMSTIKSPPEDPQMNYLNSKTGNLFLSAALTPDLASHGVLSVCQNPGNLSSDIFRHIPIWLQTIIQPFLFISRMGAYTELWAGLAPEASAGGSVAPYIIPWGRVHPCLRQDILDACKSTKDGGTGLALEYLEWCEEQIASYV